MHITNISDWPETQCPVQKYLLLNQKCLQWADRAPSRLSSSFCWLTAMHKYPQRRGFASHEHTWNAVCPWNLCLTIDYMRRKRNSLMVIFRGNPPKFLKGNTHLRSNISDVFLPTPKCVVLRVICSSQARRSPSQQPKGRPYRGAEGHSSQSAPAPGCALSSGLSPHSPLEPLPCCLTEGWDWKWDPARGLMPCHICIPREVPSAWSWSCPECPAQVSCSWLGCRDRRGCQALPADPRENTPGPQGVHSPSDSLRAIFSYALLFPSPLYV